MNLQRNKMLSSIALILILATGIFAVLPTANAHTPAWNIPTYAYLTAAPATVGVGQYTLLVMWLDTIPPTSGGSGGDRWHGFTVDVTAPDGTKTKLGPFDSDQVGTHYTTFMPTQTGTYTFVFSWPGQTATNGTGVPNTTGVPYVGDYFEPSTTGKITLVVQQQPLAEWQPAPLPTGYWSRPINGENREWSTLASNWLKGSWLWGNFQNEGQAPNSPHIVWQTPIADTPGGIADAQWPGIGYNIQDYESPWSAPIIMNGIVYYNTPAVSTNPHYGYYAVNLTNGQQLWYNNGSSIPGAGMYYSVNSGGGGVGPNLAEFFPSLTMGQLQHYASTNGNGMLAYLWAVVGSTWYMLDPQTGNWIMTLVNVPSGTQTEDQDGNILVYSYNPANGNLLCWNSTQAIPPPGPTGTAQQQWRPRVGATIDAQNDSSWTNYPLLNPVLTGGSVWSSSDVRPRSGYTMNVTIPAGLPVLKPPVPGGPGAGGMYILRDDNRVPQYIFYFLNPGTQTDVTGGSGQMFAWLVKINEHVAPYSPSPDKTNTQNNNLGYTATLVYNISFAAPLSGNVTFNVGPIDYDAGVFTLLSKETMQWWGYNLLTGQLLWGPTQPQSAWDMFDMRSTIGQTAYGKLYYAGYGGVLYCFDMKTGQLLWTWTATGIGYESPFGSNYMLVSGGVTIADHKVYVYSSKGLLSQPWWRGSSIWCVSADSGTLLWKIQDWCLGLSIADGYLVAGDQYNNMITCYGKGQTATTVSASPVSVTSGGFTTVQGTVTDQSAGAPGSPAIADAYMEQWMEYVYLQQAKPTSATGVPVTLTATDQKGNSYTIGTVTCDITGNYATTWTPPAIGVYTITAAFGGSNSYHASSGETAIGVGTTSAAPAGSSSSSAPLDLYIIVATIIIIIAIVIVGILVLRKRP